MTRILLEIPQNQDIDSLLALFKRLKIRVVHSTFEPSPSEHNDEETALILAGLPAKKDLEVFSREFEESRKDKLLPTREN